MSLNRAEQMVFDYVQKNTDELRHWQGKVRGLATRLIDPHAAASELEAELWGYYVERSGVVPLFRETVQREGLRRTSMRNLADLWLRLWGPARPKKSPGDGPGARPYA